MKEKIYTIPVTDALKEAEFCPFCYMSQKLEKEVLEYTLGPSYMEDDIRAVSDELGFCERHYKTIMNEQNKLGVALMSHTHIQKLMRDIEKLQATDVAPQKSLFKKVSNPQKSQIVEYLSKTSKTCFMCKRVNDTVDRYMNSFIYLFKNDNTIKELFINSKGVCYTHLAYILEKANDTLSGEDYKNFREVVIGKELKNLKKLEEDLDFFIRKFDYKNNDIPWGDQRDVLSRVSTQLK